MSGLVRQGKATDGRTDRTHTLGCVRLSVSGAPKVVLKKTPNLHGPGLGHRRAEGG